VRSPQSSTTPATRIVSPRRSHLHRQDLHPPIGLRPVASAHRGVNLMKVGLQLQKLLEEKIFQLHRRLAATPRSCHKSEAWELRTSGYNRWFSQEGQTLNVYRHGVEA
jgi:hypothetical protein